MKIALIIVGGVVVLGVLGLAFIGGALLWSLRKKGLFFGN